MDYKIIYTETFNQNFAKTLNYIITVLCNPYAAANLNTKIEDRVNNIASFPFMFPVYQNARSEYRYTVISN